MHHYFISEEVFIPPLSSTYYDNFMKLVHNALLLLHHYHSLSVVNYPDLDQEVAPILVLVV